MGAYALLLMHSMAPEAQSPPQSPAVPPPAAQPAQSPSKAEAALGTARTREVPTPTEMAEQEPPSSALAADTATGSQTRQPTHLVTKDRVHLREGPGANYPSITILGEARVLPVIEPTDGDWAHVRHYDDRGYAHKSLLRAAQPGEADAR